MGMELLTFIMEAGIGFIMVWITLALFALMTVDPEEEETNAQTTNITVFDGKINENEKAS